MGLFSKYSRAEIDEMAMNYVQSIKAMIDGICEQAKDREPELFEYALYPYLAYLCRSAVEWKEIQNVVINYIYDVASYTKCSSKSKADQCTTISIFLEGLKDAEKKAIANSNNPVFAMRNYALQFIDSKDNKLSVNSILVIHAATNELIDTLNLEQYKAYKLPIVGRANIPKGKTYSMRNPDSSVSTYLWLDSIYYNDEEYIVLRDPKSNIIHIFLYNESTKRVSEVPPKTSRFLIIYSYFSRP